jgi:t-SNARE complex subunit (syntaxin)
MLRSGIDLTEEEQTALRQVCQIHPQVKRLNALFQQFAQMLRFLKQMLLRRSVAARGKDEKCICSWFDHDKHHG